MIVMMVPWFLMSPILMNPDSTLSIVLSLIPVNTPITSPEKSGLARGGSLRPVTCT